MQDVRPTSIREEKEFNGLLAVREFVDDLVKNCFSLYDSFMKTVAEDEARNEQLKYDLREYQFHHSYSDECSVHIYAAGRGSSDYKDYNIFASALNGGQLQGIDDFSLRLNLSFSRGKEGALENHNHEFVIKMKSGVGSISYEANFDDPAMSNIYSKLVAKLDDFPSTMTIFSRNN